MFFVWCSKLKLKWLLFVYIKNQLFTIDVYINFCQRAIKIIYSWRPRRWLFPWEFHFHKLGTSVICWSIHSQCSINHEDPLFSPMYEAALMREHEIILEIHFRSSVMSVNVIWRVWFDPILWESVHWRFFTECCYIFANNGCEETIHNSILLLWHFLIDWKILQFVLFFFQFFKTFHGVV